ncbi:integral membrane sensor signal transduction histidine kinase [Thermodesulfobium narugense DSM 14796]|uniref:histidine kinase n=1 Tax=Thermodesulfobium narugense DSM 14796 TaxID=747365 RepID=M1E8B0_9BACT|nr:ATP-binding protein [Thermodesulfobium narugense]AEE15078.1 integral membrane sensor signal transduction histidine kinase [Thermodesulfobium narugense DSM 14796]
MNSIKFRLFIFYLIISSIIFGILGTFLFFSLKSIVLESIDNALIVKSKAIATLIDEDNGINLQFSDEILKEYSKNSNQYFQIIQNSKIVEKSESLGSDNLPIVGSAKTFYFKNRILRIVPYNITINNEHLLIECAQDIENRIDLLQTYLSVLLLSIFGAILLSALGSLFIVNIMLKPIKQISYTISKLSESNLFQSHIDENVVDELKPLAISFNRTFKKLDNAFTKQKQFVSDVSHELKTPLSVIMMETEISLRKQRSIQEYINTIKQIKERAQHMKSIINTLFKLIKIENTQLLEKRILDIQEIIHKSVTLLKDQIEKKRLICNIQGNTFLIDADETLIMEVFLNLIDNAIKYNREGGTIDIFIHPEKRVEIVDSGIGIPKESLERVFDKFYRADPSRSKEIEGLGLGLSLVKEILDLHNARIEIESTPDVGTKILLSFY